MCENTAFGTFSPPIHLPRLHFYIALERTFTLNLPEFHNSPLFSHAGQYWPSAMCSHLFARLVEITRHSPPSPRLSPSPCSQTNPFRRPSQYPSLDNYVPIPLPRKLLRTQLYTRPIGNPTQWNECPMFVNRRRNFLLQYHAHPQFLHFLCAFMSLRDHCHLYHHCIYSLTVHIMSLRHLPPSSFLCSFCIREYDTTLLRTGYSGISSLVMNPFSCRWPGFTVTEFRNCQALGRLLAKSRTGRF